MRLSASLLSITILTMLAVVLTSCGGGAPTPGREMSFPDQGITIRVADGWECEVISTDWTTWQRIQKGRTNEPWIFPPITATNLAEGGQGHNNRYMYWRFKGVTGTFDPHVNPLTAGYPVPPGLWILDSQKLELLETETRILEWPGLSGTESTCRLYENTHGSGATSAIWHTYTVVFSYDPNTYEFVFSLPDYIDHRDWIDKFWESIEDVTIETG